MNYALLAHVVREGGLKIAVICRLSAIPGWVAWSMARGDVLLMTVAVGRHFTTVGEFV